MGPFPASLLPHLLCPLGLPSTIKPVSAVSLLPPLLSLVTVPALCHALIIPTLEKGRNLGVVCLPSATSLPKQPKPQKSLGARGMLVGRALIKCCCGHDLSVLRCM